MQKTAKLLKGVIKVVKSKMAARALQYTKYLPTTMSLNKKINQSINRYLQSHDIIY